jgi:septal ring factor EnvC (AmiA/AmiB activator)
MIKFIKNKHLLEKSADELEKLLKDADIYRYEARFERGKFLKRIEQIENEIASIKQEETYSCIKKDKLENTLKILEFELLLVEAEIILTEEKSFKIIKDIFENIN